jgi:HAT1-interacting factor 1
MAGTADPELDFIEDATDDQSTEPQDHKGLAELIAQATAKYALKEYYAAAELYSQATELQAELNGEMSPENADLLYLYGRCLYHVAVKNSDVFGDRLAGDKTDDAPKLVKKSGAGGSKFESKDEHGEAQPGIIASAIEGSKEAESSKNGQPFFQFEGDDGYDDSDEDGDDENGNGEEPAEEQDDFSDAFEVLDLARVLLDRKIESIKANEGGADKADLRQLRERLADTHDLQAEIALEGERFQTAVEDLRAALALKEELYPLESSLIAETHYKLGLALEFSSVTRQTDENGEVDESQLATVDEKMREEAAQEMEKAISSCKKRVELEEAALAAGNPPNEEGKKSRITRESIDDVKEMMKEMQLRVRIRHESKSTGSQLKISPGSRAQTASSPSTRVYGVRFDG